MAKEKRSGNVIWGICTNTNGYDQDGEHHKCSKCENKEKQSIRVSKEFVCEECGEPLQKCKPPKPKIPKGVIFAIVALLLIVACAVAYFLLRGSNDTNPEDPVPETLSLNKKAISLNVGDCDTLVVTVSPVDAEAVTAYKSDNDSIAVVSELGVVRALKEGTTMVVCYGTSNQGDTISDTCKIVVNQKEMPEPLTEDVESQGEDKSNDKPSETSNPRPRVQNTKTYYFGKYVGNLKNGIPEGDGKMYYNRRIQIAKHDTDNPPHYAEAGDWFYGNWGNGDIVSGALYRKDGTIKEKIFAPRRFNPHDLNKD